MAKRRASCRSEGETGTTTGSRKGIASRGYVAGEGGFDSHRGVSLLVIIHLSNR